MLTLIAIFFMYSTVVAFCANLHFPFSILFLTPLPNFSPKHFDFSISSAQPKYKQTPSLPKFSQCPLCNFALRQNKSNSSPYDLIIGGVVREIIGIIPFIRTIRTVKSAATVVFLIDNAAQMKLSQKHRLCISQCDINLVQIENVKSYALLTLFVHVFHYLYVNQDWIHRVIKADIFDSVFQGDPFTEYFDTKKIYFFSERHWLCHSGNFYLDIFRKHLRYYSDFPQKVSPLDRLHINNGILAGGCKVMLGMFDSLFHYIPLHIVLKYHLDDQICLNQAVHQGYLDLNNVSYEIDPPNIHFSTFLHDPIPENSSVFGNVRRTDEFLSNGVTEGAPFLQLVHKYDRYPSLSKSINEACFQENNSLFIYIRDHWAHLPALKNYSGRPMAECEKL